MEFDLTQGVQVLARTPGTLRAMLAGLDAHWTAATEPPHDAVICFKELVREIP